mmetsp:Transcript_8976/g.28377  ORF Transcript_8976/g.28377 Transcript_8976/m.28377 type:complete len:287 (+) Transcript_8976:3471-4331(+)
MGKPASDTPSAPMHALKSAWARPSRYRSASHVVAVTASTPAGWGSTPVRGGRSATRAFSCVSSPLSAAAHGVSPAPPHLEAPTTAVIASCPPSATRTQATYASPAVRLEPPPAGHSTATFCSSSSPNPAPASAPRRAISTAALAEEMLASQLAEPSGESVKPKASRHSGAGSASAGARRGGSKAAPAGARYLFGSRGSAGQRNAPKSAPPFLPAPHSPPSWRGHSAQRSHSGGEVSSGRLPCRKHSSFSPGLCSMTPAQSCTRAQTAAQIERSWFGVRSFSGSVGE